MVKELEDLELIMRKHGITLREIDRTLQQAYEEACREDVGLHEAWMKARESDPDIGWLDVAADREKRGLNE